MLSSAQILALHDTPVQVIAAPVSGKVIVILGGLAVFHVVHTPYTPPGGALEILHWYDVQDQSLLAASVDSASPIGLSGFPDDLANFDGQPAMIQANSSNPTGGDGTLTITILYTIVDLS
jgi:hypothetical protein